MRERETIQLKVKRFDCNPIIHLEMSPSLDGNINGPSLIQAPAWLSDPLGEYYLYFAHHAGSFIRLAYSDNLVGPWGIYEPGTLRIEQSHCYNHVASPDVHVDDEKREIRMYYHRLGRRPGPEVQGRRFPGRPQLRGVVREPWATLLQGFPVAGLPLRGWDARSVLPFQRRPFWI